MTAPTQRGWLSAALLALALAALADAGTGPPPPAVEITAHRFEFSPPEVTVERGRTTVLRLTSLDVTHGFYSKQLGLDELIEHGKTLEVKLKPEEAGRYTVICDHFCGAGHGGMKMTIVVR